MKSQKEFFGVPNNEPKHHERIPATEIIRHGYAEKFGGPLADWELELVILGTARDHKLRADFPNSNGVRLFSINGDLFCTGDPTVIVASVGRDLDIGDTFGTKE